MRYEYPTIKFNRNLKSPVSQEEYVAIKSSYTLFIEKLEEDLEEKYSAFKNPYAFSKKYFFVLLGVAATLYIIRTILDTLGNFDTREIVDMILFLPLAALVMQPVLYVMSFSGTYNSKRIYMVHAKMYYELHDEKIYDSNSYEEYINSIQR